MQFSSMDIPNPIVKAMTRKGYSEATEIQEKSMPHALGGFDILGTAQTGTGKTCAFAVPILSHLHVMKNNLGKNKSSKKNPKSLVLCPTRELAQQVHKSFLTYGKYVDLRCAVVYGGVKQYQQVKTLKQGVDILVATPGRLKDLHTQGVVKLSNVEIVVLDEADTMLDMGFIHDIKEIMSFTSETKQTMLFSATISKDIRKLANGLLKDPKIVETAPESSVVENIDHEIFITTEDQKLELVSDILKDHSVYKALVFSRTKYKSDKLAKNLKAEGFNVGVIHSNKTQRARESAMKAFRSGKSKILIATDVAARGINVTDITHVVNYDMPVNVETFVHRIGRTARAGASGMAITFCNAGERRMIRLIEKRTGIKFPSPMVLARNSDFDPEEDKFEEKKRRRPSRKKKTSGRRKKSVRGLSEGKESSKKASGRRKGKKKTGKSLMSKKSSSSSNKKRNKNRKKRLSRL